MALDAPTNSTIIAEFRDRTRRSAEQAEVARKVLPSGITHDSRHMLPYPVTVDQGKASRKWDIDGNEYVDYFGGHGALILGHCHPRVTAAIKEALEDGTQFAASTTRECTWGQAVIDMVPSVERVRFTASGTEATLLALRLARAFTGRTKLLRFASYFHGWHDHMTSGYSSHFDGSPTAGVLPSIAADVVLVPPNDVEAARAALAGGDVAAVIIEPTGASFGRVPVADGRAGGAARGDRPDRHPPHLRRGDLRLPRGARRRAGGVRRDPRPYHHGQDRRRRAAGRGRRRTGRHHGADRLRGRGHERASRRSPTPARSTPIRSPPPPASPSSTSSPRAACASTPTPSPPSCARS